VLVLDATARSNMTYELLGGGVMIADVPSGVRNYDNVTLHVARTTSGMGKTKMEKAKHTRMPRLTAELAKELPRESSISNQGRTKGFHAGASGAAYFFRSRFSAGAQFPPSVFFVVLSCLVCASTRPLVGHAISPDPDTKSCRLLP
jgi:hypothetical protein